MQCAGLLFQIPRHVHTWTTRTVDRHNFAGLPLNPYFVAGLIHGGWAHAASVSFGFRVTSKRLGNYGSKYSTGSANSIFFLVVAR